MLQHPSTAQAPEPNPECSARLSRSIRGASRAQHVGIAALHRGAVSGRGCARPPASERAALRSILPRPCWRQKKPSPPANAGVAALRGRGGPPRHQRAPPDHSTIGPRGDLLSAPLTRASASARARGQRTRARAPASCAQRQHHWTAGRPPVGTADSRQRQSQRTRARPVHAREGSARARGHQRAAPNASTIGPRGDLLSAPLTRASASARAPGRSHQSVRWSHQRIVRVRAGHVVCGSLDRGQLLALATTRARSDHSLWLPIDLTLLQPAPTSGYTDSSRGPRRIRAQHGSPHRPVSAVELDSPSGLPGRSSGPVGCRWRSHPPSPRVEEVPLRYVQNASILLAKRKHLGRARFCCTRAPRARGVASRRSRRARER